MSSLEPFAAILNRAAERKGGIEQTLALAEADSPVEKIQASDDRWLATFTKQIFQSGFVWRVVEQKWPDFERVFFDFNIEKMLMMSDEMWENKSSDASIIRNHKKVMTIKANAQMIYEVSLEHGSFSNFINNWPKDDIIGLWAYLKKHGQRLGGNTGPYALRRMGFDTFLLSRDNEAYFRAHQLIEGGLTSKRSMTTIEQCFIKWQQESGYSLQTLSRIVSYSVGDNIVGMQR